MQATSASGEWVLVLYNNCTVLCIWLNVTLTLGVLCCTYFSIVESRPPLASHSQTIKGGLFARKLSTDALGNYTYHIRGRGYGYVSKFLIPHYMRQYWSRGTGGYGDYIIKTGEKRLQ